MEAGDLMYDFYTEIFEKVMFLKMTDNVESCTLTYTHKLRLIRE